MKTVLDTKVFPSTNDERKTFPQLLERGYNHTAVNSDVS